MHHASPTARHLLIALLGVWLGALVAVGAGAAIAFPTMKKLNPTLPEFGAVGDHWSIAAGSVFQPMFIGVLVVAVSAGVLASAVTILYVRHMNNARRLTLNVLVIVATLTAVGGLVVARGMRSNWLNFLDAAKAGDTAAAATARAAFDKSHPISSTLLKAQAAIVLMTLIAAITTGKRPAEKLVERLA